MDRRTVDVVLKMVSFLKISSNYVVLHRYAEKEVVDVRVDQNQ